MYVCVSLCRCEEDLMNPTDEFNSAQIKPGLIWFVSVFNSPHFAITQSDPPVKLV